MGDNFILFTLMMIMKSNEYNCVYRYSYPNVKYLYFWFKNIDYAYVHIHRNVIILRKLFLGDYPDIVFN